MYELVNTSLPNGLIAGTHGFATVAMTKGVSDVLRGRLEALCAYTHRTSVHDASYYLQNPVNWFHVTLPHGEHVVGRVAPSEFDYTGRTNRIARLRVFGAHEMPSVGGAEILCKEKNWFSRSWQGEPRYLEEDGNTCGHLRMLDPLRISSAPAWDALFGNGGSRYAQQVAWQVEKNLSAGGKTVYFKTSTAWDVSGEKLLGLFTDVINLLPVEMRLQVTFSTYSASLPSGIGCCLRGVYDRDRLFDVSSSVQAWIDCENARIVHPEKLPTCGVVREIGSGSEHRNAGNGEGRFRVGSPVFQPDANRMSVQGGASVRYRDLVSQRKKGPDMVIVWLVTACVAVLLAAGGFFLWMISQSKQRMEASGAAAAVEEEIKALEDKKEQQERLAKEQHDAERREALERAEKESYEKEAARKANAEKEADEAKRKLEREKAAKKAKAAADYEAEKAREKAERHKKRQTAFMTAHLEGKGRPPKPEPGIRYTAKTQEVFNVYYYMDGGLVFTNELAGFKPLNAPGNKNKIIDYALYVRDSVQRLKPLEKSTVVLWLRGGKVWYDWSQREVKAKRWFEKSESKDLQTECFGTSEDVYANWNKVYPVKYIVSWGNERGQLVEWETRRFNIDDAVDVVYRTEMRRLAAAVKESEKDIAANSNKVIEVQKSINECNKKISEYGEMTNRISGIEIELKSLKEKEEKAKKKGDKEEEDKCKEKIRALRAEKKKIDEAVKKVNIQEIKNDIEEKKEALSKLNKKEEKLCKELRRRKDAYKKVQEDPDRRKYVRERRFSVSVKGVN